MCIVAIGMMAAGCASYPTKSSVIQGGHIAREHGKPVCGYYDNWDPKPVTIEVTPLEDTNPVQTQHVLIATVRDAQGNPLPSRRVEWMIAEGSVGSIVEVDESGWYDTRGYKVNNSYAVSHTNQGHHVLTRGNADSADDIVLEKGQTWCSITSAVEGDTHVIAYAPGIYDWDKHKVFVVKHWNDAAWEWPANATNPMGTPHDLVVKVKKASDGSPIANALVTFKIVSGPDATLSPGEKTAVTVKTDAAGIAKVTLKQVKPVEGVNTIEMDIVRQPCGECAQPMRLATGKVTKTWVGPKCGITKTAPAKAGAGDEIMYQIKVTNPGQAAMTNARVTDTLPAGIEYVSSQPAAERSGQNLTWTLATVKPGESVMIAVKAKATKTGTFENCAEVTSDYGGLKCRACATTVVTSPQLSLDKTSTPEVLICEPITYTLTVKNGGDGLAMNVKITDTLPDGLKVEGGSNPVNINVGTLDAGQSKKFTYRATATKSGTFENKAVATADGGLKDDASSKVIVRQPVLAVTKTGPAQRFAGLRLTYEITVTNKGDGPARNTMVTDMLPAGLTFISATENGQFANGRITWSLGVLDPGASKKMSVTVKADQMGKMKNVVTAQATCTEASADITTDVGGVPGILLEMVDVTDPIQVGDQETYIVTVTNQGTAPDNNIKIVCTIPAEEDYVSSSGVTTGTVAGKVVTFAPLPSLAAKAKAEWRVVVKANKANDVRFKVDLNSDMLTSPVIKTESTHIFGE